MPHADTEDGAYKEDHTTDHRDGDGCQSAPMGHWWLGGDKSQTATEEQNEAGQDD